MPQVLEIASDQGKMLKSGKSNNVIILSDIQEDAREILAPFDLDGNGIISGEEIMNAAKVMSSQRKKLRSLTMTAVLIGAVATVAERAPVF